MMSGCRRLERSDGTPVPRHSRARCRRHRSRDDARRTKGDGMPLGAGRAQRGRGSDDDAFLYEKSPTSIDVRDSYKKVAATYSPTWWGSTIGDGELNFSVRNGKRWILTAITATVCF